MTYRVHYYDFDYAYDDFIVCDDEAELKETLETWGKYDRFIITGVEPIFLKNRKVGYK